MKRDMNLFIKDILQSIEKIESFSKNLTKEKFMSDKLRQDAIIRNLEVIGESAKNIPDSFRNKYSKIPWKEIAGFRDILIHAYFGVNMERVWNIIKKDLSNLKKEIGKIKIDE
ncbi:MAG: DUF86 domain-containing protein [Nanoarchaeota archaeon]|nr:DUF86 domain-containing protein [Nanoarchaeota archaeon]MBU0963100.1 DUF86 domain-containing protein [Nanoarchaeota archaeon]